MKNEFVELVRELQGTVRARRQQKIREVELAWTASELAAFRLFVQGLHASEMADICYALADAQAIPLLDILGDFAQINPELMKIAFAAMEKTSQPARLYLGKRLITSKDPQVRARACRLLGNSGPQAAPMIAQALQDSDAKVQQAAITAIGRGEFKSLEPRLGPFLRSESRNVRLAALGAIGHLGAASPALNDDLLAILQSGSRDDTSMRLAADLLARSASRRGRSILLAALQNQGAAPALRLAAADALSGYDDPGAIKAVLGAAEANDANLAKTARLALSRRQSPVFARELAENLADDDVRIAELAAEVLGGLDASIAGGILLERLKTEKRVPVINAIAKALGNAGVPGAWQALLAKQREEKILSPEFFSALADAAEDANLAEFASFFSRIDDLAVRRVIMDRLALFARATPVGPEVAALATEILNSPDQTFHLQAAAILARLARLEPPLLTAVLECLAANAENDEARRAVRALLRGREGALAEVFLGAPDRVAPLLAYAATEAASIGAGGAELFRAVASWARRDAPGARAALRNMARLAPATLAAAMAESPDRLYLLEAWSRLPERERLAHWPPLAGFFAKASPPDAIEAIGLLNNLRDVRSLRDMADVAFTAKAEDVRRAALALTRQLILTP